jgi:hypothetical protein
MTTQYLIRKVETCPVCKGEEFLYNPEWAELNEEHARRCKGMPPDERFAEFNRMVKEKWPFGEPPEEEPCCECEGTGKIETWIDLRQALEELYASAPPSGIAHHVWCTCGRNTVCTWNPDTERYAPRDEGWTFHPDRGGWTCPESNGDHAALHITVTNAIPWPVRE